MASTCNIEDIRLSLQKSELYQNLTTSKDPEDLVDLHFILPSEDYLFSPEKINSLEEFQKAFRAQKYWRTFTFSCGLYVYLLLHSEDKEVILDFLEEEGAVMKVEEVVVGGLVTREASTEVDYNTNDEFIKELKNVHAYAIDHKLEIVPFLKQHYPRLSTLITDISAASPMRLSLEIPVQIESFEIMYLNVHLNNCTFKITTSHPYYISEFYERVEPSTYFDIVLLERLLQNHENGTVCSLPSPDVSLDFVVNFDNQTFSVIYNVLQENGPLSHLTIPFSNMNITVLLQDLQEIKKAIVTNINDALRRDMRDSGEPAERYNFLTSLDVFENMPNQLFH